MAVRKMHYRHVPAHTHYGLDARRPKEYMANIPWAEVQRYDSIGTTVTLPGGFIWVDEANLPKRAAAYDELPRK